MLTLRIQLCPELSILTADSYLGSILNREQVAHELRTPLTTIKGVLNLLGSGRLNRLPAEVADELMERARKQLVTLEGAIVRIEAEFEEQGAEDRVIILCEELADARMP